MKNTVSLSLQVDALYKSWKQKCPMEESTAVWPWTQQERLTNTSTSLFSVSNGFIAQCILRVLSSIDADLPPPPAVPPSIRDNSGDSPVVVNVLVGKSVTLECESNAVPPPVITWYKNGRVVTESANLRVLAEGQILEIKGSEVRDEWKPAMMCRVPLLD